MKILLIGQLPKEAGGNYTTGAAKVVYELSKQHVDGLELHLYATNAPDEKASRSSSYPNQYIGYRKTISGILSDVLLHPCRTIREWKHYKRVDHESVYRFAFYKSNISRAIKHVKPDLIHVNSIGNVSPTRFALEGKRIPILLTCHGIFYRGEADDVKRRDMYMGNLPLCDYFTGLTEEARHEFTDILGVPADKYTIIPNGVDTAKFFFSEEWRGRIRKEMEVAETTKVFMTVASLQERKGQLVFMKMLERLGIDYQYWLVGVGPDKEAIEQYVSEKGLSGKVKLLGYKNSDELYKYYSAADVYAHSSWKEGQALTEIEAYATGLRTIVNKAIAGTLVEDAGNSNQYCVVDFEDIKPESIKEWIYKETGQRVSRANYDWRIILEKYSEVYKALLKTL